jgi:biotin-dependent carboxylase-like uncharacterized protein
VEASLAPEDLDAVGAAVPAEHVVEVVYGGADLDAAAARLGLTAGELAARHAAGAYTVLSTGFRPGFVYLGPLDPSLRLPRRPAPRPDVPAGAVAIAEAQTGVYGVHGPGGWWLIGRTARPTFDPWSDPPTPFRIGDRLRFAAIPGGAAGASSTATREVGEAPGAAPGAGRDAIASTTPEAGWIEVVAPGPLTTVQDLGRPGFGSWGVPEGGALDRAALRSANRAVGNPAGAPGLELTIAPPTLVWRGTSPLAAAAVVDGETQSLELHPGERWRPPAPRRHARGYLAFAGGVSAGAVLGGRGTCLAGGFGGVHGRALQAGDRLPVAASRPQDSLDPAGLAGAGLLPPADRDLPRSDPDPEAIALSRRASFLPDETPAMPVWPGPLPGAAALLGELCRAPWTAGQGDRIGLPLEGRRISSELPGESIPLGPGAIQLTGEGRPLLLLRDHPTVGGYPVIGVLAEASLDAAARLRPGQPLRFVPAGR